jgi:hypothetical protein
VLPTLDLSVPSQVSVATSLTVVEVGELSPSDVTVQVLGDNNEPLAASSSPDPNEVLPITELRGLTAHALYTFDNPDNRTVTAVVVTVKGDSATFPIGQSDEA